MVAALYLKVCPCCGSPLFENMNDELYLFECGAGVRRKPQTDELFAPSEYTCSKAMEAALARLQAAVKDIE